MPDPRPLYQQLAAGIRDQIGDGSLAEGDRAPRPTNCPPSTPSTPPPARRPSPCCSTRACWKNAAAWACSSCPALANKCGAPDAELTRLIDPESTAGPGETSRPGSVASIS